MDPEIAHEIGPGPHRRGNRLSANLALGHTPSSDHGVGGEKRGICTKCRPAHQIELARTLERAHRGHDIRLRIEGHSGELLQQLPVDRRRKNVIAYQPDVAIFEKGLLEKIDQPNAQITRRAHIVDDDQIGPMLACIGEEHRFAHHWQEQHRVAHTPISLREDRGWERWKVPAKIGQIPWPVIERAPDYQKCVVPSGGCLLTRDVLTTADLFGRDRIDLFQCRSLGNVVKAFRCSHPHLSSAGIVNADAPNS